MGAALGCGTSSSPYIWIDVLLTRLKRRPARPARCGGSGSGDVEEMGATQAVSHWNSVALYVSPNAIRWRNRARKVAK